MKLEKLKSLPKNELAIHLLLYIIGVFIMPLGVVFTINAHVGAGGYDALNFALGDKLGINTSFAIYITAFIAVLIAAIIRKSYPNLLTFITSFFMGLATDFWKFILKGMQADTFITGLLFTAIGMIIVAFAVSAYVISYFPSNPTDDLMVALSEKKIRLSVAKICMDIICVLIAFALGGEIGIGTIIVTFGLGLIVELFYKMWIGILKKIGIKNI